jgi:hypothetical protein
VRNFAASTFFAVGLLSACVNSSDGVTVAESGKADRFFPLSSPPEYLGDDLPAGVAMADLRIGNDNCYYYIRNGNLERLGAEGDQSRQLCLET